VCTNTGNGCTQHVLHLGKPFACRLGEDPRHRVRGLKTRCRLLVFSAPVPLAFECRLPLRRGRNEVSAFDRGNEIDLPVSGANAWCGLPAFVDGDHAGVAGDADPSRGITVEEDPAGILLDHGGDPERFLVDLVALSRCLPFVASLPSEIGGRAQQRAQVVDGALGFAEVFPGDVNHIGKQLLVLAGFAHQFEDQEFMKSQAAKALEVAGELARLSLLRRSRVKIFIYSTVCHAGRRLLQGKDLGGDYLMVIRFGGAGDGRRVDETEQLGSLFSEVEVGTTKQACLAIAPLWRADDQAGLFEIIEATIERAHGLHGAASKQFAARVNCRVRAMGVDGASEGREQGAGTGGDAVQMCGAMRGAKDDPREIGGVAGEFGEGIGINFDICRISRVRANVPLAGNEVLRDRHVYTSISKKWMTHA
jgi:hypothetical protein